MILVACIIYVLSQRAMYDTTTLVTFIPRWVPGNDTITVTTRSVFVCISRTLNYLSVAK